MSREDGPPDRTPSGRADTRNGWLADPRLAIVRRELASLKSEKTIVLALLIQLFIAAFSSLLVVGLVSMYDPASVQGYSVDVAVAGNASGPLLEAIEDVEGVGAERFADAETAATAFDAGRADAMLLSNYGADDRVHVEAVAPEGSLRSTLVVVQLREVLERLETDLRTERAGRLDHDLVPLPEEANSSPYFGFSYTVLLPLLMFLPAFMSGSIAVDTISEEVTRGTLELLRVSPVTLGEIVDAKLAAATVLGPAQAALWLVLLAANGTRVVHGVALVVAVFAFTLLVVAFGIGVSLAFADRTKAQLVYSLAILVAAGVGSFLPEHPANTVARLAIGSAGPVTWASLVGYLVLAIGGFLGVRRLTASLDVDHL